MKLLSVPGVFGMAVGIVGLAFLADAVGGMSTAPQNANPYDPQSSGGLDLSGLFDLSARADEMAAAHDLSDLLRIDLPNADVTLDGGISTEVTGTSTIRKVAFGNASDVQVYSTASGTYSTDGLASRHVLYPGIEVAPHPHPVNVHASLVWQSGYGWVPAPDSPTRSIVTYHRTMRDVPGGTDCVIEAGVRLCG